MKYKYLRLLPLALLAFGMSSCLKNDLYPTDATGTSSVLELGDISYPESFATVPLAYDNNMLATVNDTVGFNINVDFAGADYTVPEDVTLQIAFDTAAVSTYNNNEGLGYLQVPAGSISFPSTITIPKGQHLAYGYIVINGTNLLDSTQYAFGLNITSTSYGTLSGNHSSAVYEFSLANN